MNSIIQRHQKADAILAKHSDQLGERIVANASSPYTGDFEEIGNDLKEVIREAKNDSLCPLEAVERTLKAITGCGFSHMAGV